MSSNKKPRVIKDYEKLSTEILEQIKLVYPKGYRKHLIEFTGIDGKKRKGLPFETEEKYYLIRMTMEEAVFVIAEDDDYDDNGNLKPKIQAKLADKYDDEDHLDDFNSNADNDYGDDDLGIDNFDDELDGDADKFDDNE